jgi:hypothetical protein
VTVLAPSPELASPEQQQHITKLFETAEIVGNTVVSLPTSVHRREPASHNSQRPVTATTQLQLDGRERTSHPFGDGEPEKRESLPVAGSRADMGESEKVKRLTFPPTLAFAFRRAAAAEFNQTCLVGVKSEPELLEPLC